MPFPLKRSFQGFLLIELGIVIAIISSLLPILFEGISSWQKWQAEERNADLLKEATENILRTYQNHLIQIEESTSRDIVFGNQKAISSILDSSGRCQPNSESLQLLQASSIRPIIVDGYKNMLCLIIGPQHQKQVSGISLVYRIFYLISPGQNGKSDSLGPNCPAKDAVIQQCGDDHLIRIDGFPIAYQSYLHTAHKISRIVETYESYFQVQYLQNPSRDIGINYFAKADPSLKNSRRWDQYGLISTSGCHLPQPLIQEPNDLFDSPHHALGFSHEDVNDSYGQIIQIDNCSDKVRSPQNSVLAKQLPPYTAHILTKLPGNILFTQSAIGNF